MDLRRALFGFAVLAGFGAATPGSANGPWPASSQYASNWHGLYGGVHLGYGESGSADGVLGGAQIGYNWQGAGQIVWGVEGDISLSDISVEETVCVPLAGCANAEASIDWMATLRGRLGILVDPQVLAYATAGVGIVGASAEASVPGLTFSDDDTETDFVYGLGLEGNISPGMSARIEYLGYADLDIDVIRAGLNFKLGR